MLIRIANQADEKAWDEFVSNHPDASPYHRFAWRKSIENSYCHKCIYLVAENDAGEVTGILPSVLIRPPLSRGELCSLPFCDRGEALGINPVVEVALVEKACEIATENGVDYIYRALRDKFEDHKRDDNRLAGEKVSMLLDLPDSSEALLSGFKSKLRSQINKAEKNGLTFETGREEHLINDFYQVFTTNMRDLGSPTHSKRWFEEITRCYKDEMIISVVKFQDQPVGAGFVLFNGNIAAIPWASTKREFNRLAPNMLLYWSLLEYATDRGCRCFDFGRSSYGEGTFKFKQQWGARPVAISWKTYSNAHQGEPETMSTMNKGKFRIMAESVWRNLPLPITIMIGSSIRKYISL